MKGGDAPVIATPPFSNRCKSDDPFSPRQQYVSVPTDLLGGNPETDVASDYDFFVIIL